MPKGLRRRYQSARAPEHSGHLSCCEPEAEAQARRRQPVPPAAPSSASGRLSLPPVPRPHLFVRTAVIQDRGRPATPFYLPRLFRGPASKRSRVLRSRGWGFSVWIGKGGGRGTGDTTQPTMDTKARTLSPLETFLENAGSLLGHRPSSQRRSVAGEPEPGPSLPTSRRRCCRGRGPHHRKVFPRRGARGEGVRMRGGHLRAERTPPLPGPAPGREAGTRSP